MNPTFFQKKHAAVHKRLRDAMRVHVAHRIAAACHSSIEHLVNREVVLVSMPPPSIPLTVDHKYRVVAVQGWSLLVVSDDPKVMVSIPYTSALILSRNEPIH